jgi:hypothetical protein
MSHVLLHLRTGLAFALVLGVATVAPGQDKKKSPPKKKPAGPKIVALDSLDMTGYPKVSETSKPGERSKEALEKVLAQFKVETNKRYLPRSGATFCNIYTRDVCHALGCKIPYGMLANGIYDWLPSKEGKAAGWVQVTADEAQKAANEGRPAVVSWKNPKKIKTKDKDGKEIEKPAHGHIAVVRPSDQPGGPYLSNAGAKNLEKVSVKKIFSEAKLKNAVKFYANK